MFHRLLSHFKKLDWILLSAVLLLVGFGLAAIYSVGLGNGGVYWLNFQKQVIFIIIGLVFLFIFSFFDFHSLYRLNWWIYGFGVSLLVLVLLFGQTVRGTTAWFNFFGFSLQPSEIMKIIMALVLARYFSSASYKTKQLKHLFLTFFFTAIPAALILLQPDFGSAMIIFIFWIFILGIFGLSRKQFLIISLIVLVLFTFSFFFLLKNYQKQRVVTFLDPSIGSLSKGYNIAQATIAIGAGKFFGRGLGFGSQSQLKFLPESQNDFIFAVIAEEMGLIGVTLVLFFFAVFFYRAVYWIRRINNNFGLYIILGASVLFFTEMFINIGMNIGIIPVVGISLPFVSYGGSSLIASLILVGIIESVIIYSRKA